MGHCLAFAAISAREYSRLVRGEYSYLEPQTFFSESDVDEVEAVSHQKNFLMAVFVYTNEQCYKNNRIVCTFD